MNNPLDPDNRTAKAMLDAERITAGAHQRNGKPAERARLFDPAWNPEMWKRANSAVRDLWTGVADNSIRLVDNDNLTELDNLPDNAVVVWRVGATRAEVARPGHQIDWFTWAVQFAQELDDYQAYTTDIRPHPADYELRCTVNIAADCTAPFSRDVSDYGGGTTRLMPLRRGRFVLLFRCCRACEAQAGKTADTNYKNHVVEARADLPPGAVILPNPEKPTDPDDLHYSAWA